MLLQIVASLGETKEYSWRNELKLKFLKVERTLPPPKVENGMLLVRTMLPISLMTKDDKAIFPPHPKEENLEEKLKRFNEEFNQSEKPLTLVRGVSYFMAMGKL